MRVQGGSYAIVATGVLQQTYTVTGLSLGTTYDFTIEAYNANGFSLQSEPITILHAIVPETPIAPTTANAGTNIQFSWTAPYDSGAAITSYTVLIKQGDGNFSEETVNCDGSDATIVANR